MSSKDGQHPKSIILSLSSATVGPTTNTFARYRSNATADVAPEPRGLGQQKKVKYLLRACLSNVYTFGAFQSVKPGDLDLLPTEFVATMKMPDQTSSNPVLILKGAAATASPVPTLESSTAGTTSASVVIPLKHEEVHPVDHCRALPIPHRLQP